MKFGWRSTLDDTLTAKSGVSRGGGGGLPAWAKPGTLLLGRGKFHVAVVLLVVALLCHYSKNKAVTLEPQLTNRSPLPSAVQGHADWKTLRGPWPRAALLLFIQLSVAASFWIQSEMVSESTTKSEKFLGGRGHAPRPPSWHTWHATFISAFSTLQCLGYLCILATYASLLLTHPCYLCILATSHPGYFRILATFTSLLCHLQQIPHLAQSFCHSVCKQLVLMCMVSLLRNVYPHYYLGLCIQPRALLSHRYYASLLLSHPGFFLKISHPGYATYSKYHT